MQLDAILSLSFDDRIRLACRFTYRGVVWALMSLVSSVHFVEICGQKHRPWNEDYVTLDVESNVQSVRERWCLAVKKFCNSHALLILFRCQCLRRIMTMWWRKPTSDCIVKQPEAIRITFWPTGMARLLLVYRTTYDPMELIDGTIIWRIPSRLSSFAFLKQSFTLIKMFG